MKEIDAYILAEFVIGALMALVVWRISVDAGIGPAIAASVFLLYRFPRSNK